MDIVNANVRNCVALVVGVSDYDHRPKLKNAVNDATVIAGLFEKLKYEVHLLPDATKSEFEDALAKIMNMANDYYDIIVIYFAGHGMFCNKSDCIIFKDALRDDTAALMKSYRIEHLYQNLRVGSDGVIIAIIDACRVDAIVDETDERGEIDSKFAAHIKLPYQTYIAFATSPHAPAKDGYNGHSPYTQALLDEIPNLNQPIEITFKNVRRKLFKGIGDQLPWEHSCLADEVSFNFGQLEHHYGCLYSPCVFYGRKQLNESHVLTIVDSLFDKKDFLGLVKFIDGNVRSIISEPYDIQFVIGRILANAYSREIPLTEFIFSKQSINRFFSGEANHLFNGILYEQYFDSSDKLRPHGLNNRLYDIIYNIIGDSEYKDSKNFIQHELGCVEYSGYIPGTEIEKRFQAQIDEFTPVYDSGISYLFLTKLTLKSMPIGFDLYELGIQCSIKELRQFLLEKSHCPSMLFGLRIDGGVDVDSDDLIILGDYDKQALVNTLDKYFNVENRSSLDELCHHYELCDIQSLDVLDFVIDDDIVIAKGQFSISTVMYFDNEDDTRTDVSLDGTFEICMQPAKNGMRFELEPFSIEARIDDSKFYK